MTPDTDAFERIMSRIGASKLTPKTYVVKHPWFYHGGQEKLLHEPTTAAYRRDGEWCLTPAGAWLVQIAFDVQQIYEGVDQWVAVAGPPDEPGVIDCGADPAAAVLAAAIEVVNAGE